MPGIEAQRIEARHPPADFIGRVARLRVLDAKPKRRGGASGATTAAIELVAHDLLQLTAGLLVCGSMLLLALVSVCCDATDAFLAQVVIPFASPFLFLFILSDLFNDASVVYDHDGISRATWFGKYGVKSLRWQDILHVETVVYRRGYHAKVIRLHGPGTRIAVCPQIYANGAKFRNDLMRHLEHLTPSERSTAFRGV